MRTKKIKLLVSLSALLCLQTGAAFADEGDPNDWAYVRAHRGCLGSRVRAPCDNVLSELGLEIIFAESGTNDQPFAFHVEGDPTSTAGSHMHYHVNDPDMNIGGEIWGSYHLGWGDDLRFSYEHLAGNNSKGHINLAHTLYPYGSISTLSGDQQIASNRYKLDAFTVELGQAVMLGEVYDVSTHFGIKGASLEDTKYLNTALSSVIIGEQSYYSKFSAIGPHAGLDAHWHLSDSVTILSEIAGGLLVGNTDSKMTFSTPTQGVVNFTRIKSPSVVFPTMSLKAALRYVTTFYSNDTQLDLGWHMETYLNSLRFYQSQVPVANIMNGVELTTPGSFASDESFSFGGPYVAIVMTR